MSDLRTLLHQAAGPSGQAISTAVADADLARARRALRRRRTKRVSAVPVLAVAAAIGAFAIVGPGNTPPSPAVATSPGATSSVKLVAYTGAQPTGYTLDEVPAGWQVDEDDLSVLVLAPAGSEPASTPGAPVGFEGKIAIMTESDSGIPTGVKLDDVQVGDRAGVIAHMRGSGDTRTLFVKEPSGAYLVIQVWSGLGWDNQQIAEFGNSVHINAGARKSLG